MTIYKRKFRDSEGEKTQSEFFSYRFRFSGSEIRITTKLSDKKKARNQAEQHHWALKSGEIQPGEVWPKPVAPKPVMPTLSDYAGILWQNLEARVSAGSMRPRSLKFYRETMERVTRFEPLKDATLDSINRATVDAYIAFRLRAKSGKSPDAINGELRTIRRVLRYAEENGVIQKCPAIHCLETKGRERTITPAEETAYLGKATGDLRDAFTLLLDTGLRPDSELFPLRWENVGEKAIRVVASKTDSGVRQVPLTPRAQAILSMRRSGKPGLTPFVFPSTGETGHLATLKKRHYKACKDAEVARFPLYLLRHTFASRLAAAGVNRYILAALMGHSSPAIADRYYAHVDQQSVLSGFQQYLDSQPKPEPATLTLAPQAPQPQPQPTIQ